MKAAAIYLVLFFGLFPVVLGLGGFLAAALTVVMIGYLIARRSLNSLRPTAAWNTLFGFLSGIVALLWISIAFAHHMTPLILVYSPVLSLEYCLAGVALSMMGYGLRMLVVRFKRSPRSAPL